MTSESILEELRKLKRGGMLVTSEASWERVRQRFHQFTTRHHERGYEVSYEVLCPALAVKVMRTK
jgi:hypothetical protein